MQSLSIRPMFALSFIGLFFGLGTCDVWLLIHSLRQDAVIATINAQRALPVASAGEKIPLIQGVSLNDGRPIEFNPGTSPRIALLVFREGCHFCAANWKNWDGLFGSSSLKVDVVFVTSDKTLSHSYQVSHPLLQKKDVILGVPEDTLNSLNLSSTPQTVYIVNGRIKQDWAGVLSEDDLRSIKLSVPGS